MRVAHCCSMPRPVPGCGDAKAFNVSVKKLCTEWFESAPLEPLPATHPVYTAELDAKPQLIHPSISFTELKLAAAPPYSCLPKLDLFVGTQRSSRNRRTKDLARCGARQRRNGGASWSKFTCLCHGSAIARQTGRPKHSRITRSSTAAARRGSDRSIGLRCRGAAKHGVPCPTLSHWPSTEFRSHSEHYPVNWRSAKRHCEMSHLSG